MSTRLARFGFVAAVCIVLLGSPLAVSRATGQASHPLVAILVVDNFEPVGQPTTDPQGLYYLYFNALGQVSQLFPNGWGLGDITEVAEVIRSENPDLPTSPDPTTPKKVHCAVNMPEMGGVGDYDLDGTSRLELMGIPHGEPVLKVIKTLTRLGNYVDLPMQDCVDSQGEQASQGICVHPVDTGGWTLDDVVTALENAQATVTADLYVINMSFAIIPCDTLAEYAAYVQLIADLDQKVKDGAASIDDLNDAVNALATDHDSRSALVNWPSLGLYGYFADKFEIMVPVAGAGNMTGVGYPFYPAAWPIVVSASASTDDGSLWVVPEDSKAQYSNSGEVMMAGTFSDPAYVDEAGIPLLLEGTSFAAPRLSAAIAYYLYQGIDTQGPAFNFCRNAVGTALGLAYVADWSMPPDVDLSLGLAADTYCTPLLPYVSDLAP